jgi:hypothetical protein
LICKVCDQFWDDFSAHSDAWERAVSNEDELLAAETGESWALIQRAAEVEDVDPVSAFRLYREAAEAGSVWSSERVGWHYWTGTSVAADPQIALEYIIGRSAGAHGAQRSATPDCLRNSTVSMTANEPWRTASPLASSQRTSGSLGFDTKGPKRPKCAERSDLFSITLPHWAIRTRNSCLRVG